MVHPLAVAVARADRKMKELLGQIRKVTDLMAERAAGLVNPIRSSGLLALAKLRLLRIWMIRVSLRRGLFTPNRELWPARSLFDRKAEMS